MNISDSHALKMGLEKYMGLVDDSMAYKLDAGYFYYAEIRHRANERLIRRLPLAKRRLAQRCYDSLESFKGATWDYCDGEGAGTMLNDFRASTDGYDEEMMLRIILDIKHAKTLPKSPHRVVVAKAWTALRKSYSLISAPDFERRVTRAELTAEYHLVESDLRKLEDVLGALPPKSRPALIKDIGEVADTPNAFD